MYFITLFLGRWKYTKLFISGTPFKLLQCCLSSSTEYDLWRVEWKWGRCQPVSNFHFDLLQIVYNNSLVCVVLLENMLQIMSQRYLNWKQDFLIKKILFFLNLWRIEDHQTASGLLVKSWFLGWQEKKNRKKTFWLQYLSAAHCCCVSTSGINVETKSNFPSETINY